MYSDSDIAKRTYDWGNEGEERRDGLVKMNRSVANYLLIRLGKRPANFLQYARTNKMLAISDD